MKNLELFIYRLADKPKEKLYSTLLKGDEDCLK